MTTAPAIAPFELRPRQSVLPYRFRPYVLKGSRAAIGVWPCKGKWCKHYDEPLSPEAAELAQRTFDALQRTAKRRAGKLSFTPGIGRSLVLKGEK